MELEIDFKKECDEWLNPLGYTIYSIGSGGNNLEYSSIEPGKPSINCFIRGSEKKCKLVGGSNCKLFITLRSGELMFKHPDIERWINLMQHYDLVISQNQLKNF